MSHFTVMVIGENPGKQLAPYQENNMGDCPEEYLAFNDVTDDVTREWEDEDQETKEKYKDLDTYATEYNGYKKNEEGRYGYWENPNAKWDWYQLGGRWSGFFKMKPGSEGEVGRAGLFSAPAEEGYADSALKKEIDFESMMEEASKKAGEKWDLIKKITEGLEPAKSWEHVRDEMFPGQIDKARTYYHDQPAMKAVSNWSSENGHSLFGLDLEDFNCTREEYCLDAARGSFVPYAVIKDGKWYQKGEMGWFGISNNEVSESKWTAQVAQMLDELPEDTMISLYDCHI
jgi:hypothetical protein